MTNKVHRHFGEETLMQLAFHVIGIVARRAQILGKEKTDFIALPYRMRFRSKRSEKS
jgi:hypothetical protein